MPPSSNLAQSLGAGLTGVPTPINNSKSVRFSKLDGGFLLEFQNVSSYGFKNNVAIDLDSAIELAKTYFID